MSETSDTTDLSSQQPDDLDMSRDRDILTFEDVNVMEQFLRNIGWTAAKEMQMLMQIIESSPSESTRLRALKQLQARRTELLKNSGFVVKATKTQRDDNGNETRFSAEVLTSAFPKQKKRSINGSNTNPQESRTTNPIPDSESTGDCPSNDTGTPERIGISSGAALHKPPTGNTGPDTVEPECSGNLIGTPSGANNSSSDTDPDTEDAGEQEESLPDSGD